MDYTRLLDHFPLWGVLVATIVVVLLSIEGGYRIGQHRRTRSEPEKEGSVAAIVAATLSLLAFMLAFTFGMAASRFEARRMVVLEESNAIGTANLRAGLLPEPQRSKLRQLFREYVDLRLQAATPGAIEEAVARSGELHAALWLQASEVAAQDNRSILTGIFVQSLNEVIDLHAKRVMFALHNRIPELVWLVLYAMAIISMTALGYQEGLSGSRRSLAVLALALTFSAVIWLIADLDRPQEGLLRVSQRAMLDLRESLKTSDTAPSPSKP